MSDLKFREMRKTLLREGIAPKHVARLVKELRDHHADLEKEAQNLGMSKNEATKHAWGNLGEENVFIQEALSRPELKSWSSKWPWAIYTLTPLLALVLLTIVWGLSVATIGTLFKAGEIWPIPAWQVFTADALTFFMSYALTPIIAISLIWFAQKKEAQGFSPLVGAILVAILGASLTPDIKWPSLEGELGSISLSMGYGFFEAPIDGGNIFNQIKLAIFLVAVTSFYYYKSKIQKRFTIE